MSYDLVFWRETAPQTASPKDIYLTVVETNDSDQFQLAALPAGEIKAALTKEFKGWRQTGANGHFVLVSPDQQKVFELEQYGNLFNIMCRGLHYTELNAIMDVFYDYGAALFDPQTTERFTQPE